MAKHYVRGGKPAIPSMKNALPTRSFDSSTLRSVEERDAGAEGQGLQGDQQRRAAMLGMFGRLGLEGPYRPWPRLAAARRTQFMAPFSAINADLPSCRPCGSAHRADRARRPSQPGGKPTRIVSCV